VRAVGELVVVAPARLVAARVRRVLLGVLGGESDVAFVLLPLEHPALEVRVLFEEPRVFLLAEDHPLADRPALTLEDLRDVPCIGLAGADEDPLVRAWVDFWTAAVLPDGSRRRVAAIIRDIDEWLEATAAGVGVNPTSASVVRQYARPGLRAVPGPELAPARHAVVWARDRPDPAVAAFVEVALAVAARADA